MKKLAQNRENFINSEFQKVIGLTQEHYIYIEKNRYKKSRAGFLKHIINTYMVESDKNYKFGS